MARTVCWSGKPLEPARRRGLGGDLRFVDAPDRDTFARVIRTERARTIPPAPGDALPWLWATDDRVDASLELEAAVRGAYDVIPLGEDGALARLAERLAELAAEPALPKPPPNLVAESVASKRVLAQIARAARTSAPVLVTGETGTGKEETAHLLHAWSPRKEKRFVPVNCAAIPNELMEGELFGYTKGAFSGAVRTYEGALMTAEGGTVFLDEIDDTPPSIQTKLLRVLEDRVVTRLGDAEPRKVDFRIVAATNRDLRRLIEKGAFGLDLFERLAIVSIQLPPLRDRPEDIPALTRHLIERFYREEPNLHGRARVTDIRPSALRALAAYPWPGNIRELRNVVFQTLIDKRGGTEILPADLPRRVLRRGEATAANAPASLDRDVTIESAVREGRFNLRAELERIERTALAAALDATGHNASAAARLLGEVGRGSASDPGGTVRAMMRRLGLT